MTLDELNAEVKRLAMIAQEQQAKADAIQERLTLAEIKNNARRGLEAMRSPRRS